MTRANSCDRNIRYSPGDPHMTLITMILSLAGTTVHSPLSTPLSTHLLWAMTTAKSVYPEYMLHIFGLRFCTFPMDLCWSGWENNKKDVI